MPEVVCSDIGDWNTVPPNEVNRIIHDLRTKFAISAVEVTLSGWFCLGKEID